MIDAGISIEVFGRLRLPSSQKKIRGMSFPERIRIKEIIAAKKALRTTPLKIRTPLLILPVLVAINSTRIMEDMPPKKEKRVSKKGW